MTIQGQRAISSLMQVCADEGIFLTRAHGGFCVIREDSGETIWYGHFINGNCAPEEV